MYQGGTRSESSALRGRAEASPQLVDRHITQRTGRAVGRGSVTRWGFEGSTFQGRLGHWHSPKARLAVRSREVAAVRPRHGSVGFGAPKLERDRVFWHRSLQDRRERGRFDNVDWHAAVPKAGGWTGKTSPPAKTSPSEHPNTRPILRITNGLE